jgi:ATP-dependent helicase/nuclease subunit A
LWTKEQLEAITLKGCNLLVAAGAGAGKTAVLVERIIRKITDEKDPVDIDRLLIMTFTRAAATEMRERIYGAISDALDKNPTSTLLQRQLALMNRASITTVHSFCMEVIRNNVREAGIDPKFRVADDTEAFLLKLEVMEDFLDQIYEDFIYEEEFKKSDFYVLLESYSNNKDDSGIKNLILNLYEFIRSHPWPEKWLHEHSGSFCLKQGEDFSKTRWGKVILQSAFLQFSGYQEEMRIALEILDETQELPKYQERFLEEFKMIMEITKKFKDHHLPLWNTIGEAIFRISFIRLPNKPKDADGEVCERVKKIRDHVKKGIEELWKPLFSKNSEEIRKSLITLAPLIQMLARLVILFQNMYEDKKRERSLLDFSDLEHLAIKVLVEDEDLKASKVGKMYKEKFKEILVDEYQDSNLVQEILIQSISREDLGFPNVFMVGDVKQSIYRFRQARPELFLEKYHCYGTKPEDLYRKITLYKNFRSRSQVIEGVNYIFKQIMSLDLGELHYDEKEALISGADYSSHEGENCALDVHVIHLDKDQSDEEEGSSEDHFEDTLDFEGFQGEDLESSNNLEEGVLDNSTFEARLVAKNIKKLMEDPEFKVLDKITKVYRNLEFRDIVVLLRATRKWAEVFLEEFSTVGIPVFADSETGFFKTMEVNVVISMLELIDNPLQDIPLISLLRSPIYGLSSEELADLRLASGENLLYEGVLLERVNGNPKIRKFAEDLERWREKAETLSTDELIWFLYEDTFFYSLAGAMPFGKQRQANLRILFERARQYEKTSFKGLFHFIHFLNKCKEGKGDMSSAKILGENENLVRILSIHKSKGLEFPVVFLSGCGKMFNAMDEKQRLILHQDLGFGPDIVDVNRRLIHSSIPKEALKLRMKKESVSEELRILYVAMTRAREKLILTGGVKNLKNAFQKWGEFASTHHEKIPPYKLYRGRTFLDFLMPALIRHQNNQKVRDYLEEEFKGSLVLDDSLWHFCVWKKEELIHEESAPEKIQEDGKKDFLNLSQIDIKKTHSEYKEEIQRRLEWNYNYGKSAYIPSKISVTEMKKRFAGVLEEESFGSQPYNLPLIKKPRFLQEKEGLNSAEMGTVLHFVMQNLDYKDVLELSSIKAQINKMIEKHLITETEGKSVDDRKIMTFFRSKVGVRILAANKVYREVPFNLEMPSSQVFKELRNTQYEEEIILLQGVIDCYFQEGEGLVLLDYKTDFVNEENSETIKNRYQLQMDYYKMALEKLTGMKVSQRLIYLFYNGEVLEYK